MKDIFLKLFYQFNYNPQLTDSYYWNVIEDIIALYITSFIIIWIVYLLLRIYLKKRYCYEMSTKEYYLETNMKMLLPFLLIPSVFFCLVNLQYNLVFYIIRLIILISTYGFIIWKCNVIRNFKKLDENIKLGSEIYKKKLNDFLKSDYNSFKCNFKINNIEKNEFPKLEKEILKSKEAKNYYENYFTFLKEITPSFEKLYNFIKENNDDEEVVDYYKDVLRSIKQIDEIDYQPSYIEIKTYFEIIKEAITKLFENFNNDQVFSIYNELFPNYKFKVLISEKKKFKSNSSVFHFFPYAEDTIKNKLLNYKINIVSSEIEIPSNIIGHKEFVLNIIPNVDLNSYDRVCNKVKKILNKNNFGSSLYNINTYKDTIYNYLNIMFEHYLKYRNILLKEEDSNITDHFTLFGDKVKYLSNISIGDHIVDYIVFCEKGIYILNVINCISSASGTLRISEDNHYSLLYEDGTTWDMLVPEVNTGIDKIINDKLKEKKLKKYIYVNRINIINNNSISIENKSMDKVITINEFENLILDGNNKYNDELLDTVMEIVKEEKKSINDISMFKYKECFESIIDSYINNYDKIINSQNIMESFYQQLISKIK